MEIKRSYFQAGGLSTQGFTLVPSEGVFQGVGIFTHGYTSHKDTVFPWAQKLASKGILSVVFDLPGHYLGNFQDVPTFEAFKVGAPIFFSTIFNQLQKEFALSNDLPLFIGGHSLGAMLAILAAPTLSKKPFLTLVGIGMPPENHVHVMAQAFFESILNVRAQLVSPCLNPEVMFPWFKREKENLQITDHHILVLNGEDDLIVGLKGHQQLVAKLEENNNFVYPLLVKKLPHNQPEMAATHLAVFLKEQNFLGKK